jgi:hypothetical protein
MVARYFARGGERRSVDGGRVPEELELRCFPAGDGPFAAEVQAAIARSRERLLTGRRLVETVRRELAMRYPDVAIHQRDSLGELGPEPPRLYVYRDGRIA